MYLKVNKVKAVIGNHSVYSFGLILRIAIEKNIPHLLRVIDLFIDLVKK